LEEVDQSVEKLHNSVCEEVLYTLTVDVCYTLTWQWTTHYCGHGVQALYRQNLHCSCVAV